MNSEYAEALKYLSSPAGSFWKWDDQGAVVVWTNGSTIAFREEVAFVLARLAPEGLPPLDAVLLLIAATRAYWREDSRAMRHRLESGDSQEISLLQNGASTTLEKGTDFISNLFRGLDVIHELPEELNRSTESKAEIAAIVFECAPGAISATVSKVVCDILEKRLNNALPSLSKLRGGRAPTAKSLLHDLLPLSKGLQGVTEESLRLRQKTGLDLAPQAAPVDVPVEQPAMRSFLAQLSTDEEFAGLSRLARNLSAVVQLPRVLSDSDELPLGGVSDLTNRGTLDRLLLSELAHDDLMLATRIALNEALYLRREVPPSFPPRHRHVLIDVGIRMWGVPRVFATAVVMSLAASLGKDSTLSVYRASGTDLIPVDLASREGLVAHLAALEPEVHPGRSLTEFFQHVTRSEQDGDFILVTTDAVLADKEFQRMLSEVEGPPLFAATVNRIGDFQLWSYGPRGRRCHSTLRMNLDDLFEEQSNGAKETGLKLIDESVDPNLPAILRLKSFPFRLPYEINCDLKKEVIWSIPARRTESDNSRATERFFQKPFPDQTELLPDTSIERAVFILTGDKRLLMFDKSSKGGLQLGNKLPYGKCLCSWVGDQEGQSFAVIHRESDRTLHLLTIDAAQRVVRADTLPSEQTFEIGSLFQIMGATAHGGVVFVIFRCRIEAFDVTTRAFLDAIFVDLTAIWLNHRYFFNPESGHQCVWFALSFDGTKIHFQSVPFGVDWKGSMVLRLFDRQGSDGPFIVSADGVITNSCDMSTFVFSDNVHTEIQLLDIDHDGGRILVRSVGRKSSNPVIRVVDTRTCTTTPLRETPDGTALKIVDSLVAFDATGINFGTPPMQRMTGIVIRDEQLTLISNGHVSWQFKPTSKHLVLVNPSVPHRSERLWRSIEVPNLEHGDSLRVAKWEDGSRAWIDSRGLLHLQSSDPLIPETTFLLDVNGVAVWTSRRQMLGSSYYVDEAESAISPEDVIEEILIPFVSRLR